MQTLAFFQINLLYHMVEIPQIFKKYKHIITHLTKSRLQ
jgi:hypothetical protein